MGNIWCPPPPLTHVVVFASCFEGVHIGCAQVLSTLELGTTRNLVLQFDQVRLERENLDILHH
jgi:hypothetical protein